jgi:hypothetical protein
MRLKQECASRAVISRKSGPESGAVGVLVLALDDIGSRAGPLPNSESVALSLIAFSKE